MTAKLTKQLLLESGELDIPMTPSHLAHLKPESTDVITEEDSSLPGPSGNWMAPKAKFNVVPATKQTKLGKNIVRLKKRVRIEISYNITQLCSRLTWFIMTRKKKSNLFC